MHSFLPSSFIHYSISSQIMSSYFIPVTLFKHFTHTYTHTHTHTHIKYQFNVFFPSPSSPQNCKQFPLLSKYLLNSQYLDRWLTMKGWLARHSLSPSICSDVSKCVRKSQKQKYCSNSNHHPSRALVQRTMELPTSSGFMGFF